MINELKNKLKVERARENIIPEKEMHKIVSNVFTDLSNMIAKTLGPCAGNTLITEPFASVPVYPSKDGYKVMNNHNYDDLYYESIYRIIRDVSGRMNQEVGDGTTSSVVIAADFYKRISKYLKHHKNITPYGAKKILDVALNHLSEHIKNDKTLVFPISDEFLTKEQKLAIYRNVATISANNDSDIADKVVNAYKNSNSDYAYIDIQESTNSKDVVEVNLGFELATGYILRHMANMPDGITAEYDNPLFLLIDGPILKDDVPEIDKFIKFATIEAGQPFVIFASEFCKEVCDLFVKYRSVGCPLVNRTTGKQELYKLPIMAVMLNTGSDYGVERIQDLEACLGARALQTNTGRIQNCPTTEEEFLLTVGRADSVKCVPHYIRIRGGAGSRAIRDGRIKEIQRLIKENEDAAQHGMNEMMRLETLKKRAGMLQGEMHCIKVGGDSYKEKQNRKMIFDDAIQAVKACINNGVSLGGNVSISKCIQKYGRVLINEIYETITSKDDTYNVMINTSKSKAKKEISDILNIISESSLAGFKSVFNNASTSKSWKKNIFNVIRNSKIATSYDIIKGHFDSLDSLGTSDDLHNLPTIIVPGNTDIEILKSAFCIVGMFISSNQILSVHVKHDNKV